MMVNDLIFDVGCHNGDDTDFYLRKGFRVVAIDADKALCDQVSKRFSAEVNLGRCEVFYGAVGEKSGDTVTFYICDQKTYWNTTNPYFVKQNEKEGAKYRTVDVPTINVAEMMETRGTPYYMKIDIEGADTIPLKTLVGRNHVPAYVSVEIAQHDFSEGLRQIHLLRQLGYTQFSFFNQGMRHHVKAPFPALEGRYVPFDPNATTSGLFGKEVAGRWVDVSAAERRLAGIHKRYVLFREKNRFYSPDGRFCRTLISKIHNRFRRHVLHDPVSYYDLHARIAEP
jgi:FkbM family methyltransferase